MRTSSVEQLRTLKTQSIKKCRSYLLMQSGLKRTVIAWRETFQEGKSWKRFKRNISLRRETKEIKRQLRQLMWIWKTSWRYQWLLILIQQTLLTHRIYKWRRNSLRISHRKMIFRPLTSRWLTQNTSRIKRISNSLLTLIRDLISDYSRTKHSIYRTSMRVRRTYRFFKLCQAYRRTMGSPRLV